MELAIDLALQASPDHPLVTARPEWFRHAPDGTIKHAENPPKKYQDIYPIHFYGDDDGARAALWQEWLDVVRHWIGHGVRIFRVDNPHTKPIAFWAWLIGEVQRDHPDVIFLSEAFTRPKMMQVLAKVGFSQSYTYFTWRESAAELREYLTELTQSEMREYFRGNLFTNTPDINPHHTDHGRPAFVIRTVLAATLSSSYGIYSGWELCEAARLGDREEYLDSEKYEIRARDWEAPGNIKLLVGELNRLRHEHRALQLYDNLRFENVTGDRTLFYRKALPDPAGGGDPLRGEPYRWTDAVFVAVNCDPLAAQTAILHPDLPAVGIGWDEPYRMNDLLSGEERDRARRRPGRRPEPGRGAVPHLHPAADACLMNRWRRVLGITVVALPLLAGCGVGPHQRVTCYGNGTHPAAADDACRRAAVIALSHAPRGDVLATAAEVWQGPCITGRVLRLRFRSPHRLPGTRSSGFGSRVIRHPSPTSTTSRGRHRSRRWKGSTRINSST